MEIAEYVGDFIQFTDQVSGSTDIVLMDFNYIELAKEVPKYVVSRIPSVEKEFILLKDTVDRIVCEKAGLIV